MYEERAVDVIIDNRSPDISKRRTCCASLPKIANDDRNKNNNNDKFIKIKKPQGGGTVRSIPIKDYQASIVHNIGTLRRSAAPQSQFESLVSEPEKSVYVPLRKRNLINNSHHRSSSQTCIALHSADKRRSDCFCDNQHDCRDLNRYDENDRYFNKAEDERSQDSDIDEYFRRSSRRRFSSNLDPRTSRRIREPSENAGITTVTDTKDEKTKAEEEMQTLRLAEGHVGEKISAYEQNSRHSLRSPNPKYRSVFEVKGHRTIGVPLVGMHNACGLPVVASWHDDEILDSLRLSRGLAKSIGPVYKSSRAIPRHRTQLKRKAPQPDRGMIHLRNIDRGNKKSTGCLDTANSSGRSKRKHHRSSLTITKVGSLSSKNSFKRSRRYAIKASSLVDTFGRKSVKEGNVKRTTLYAKDDGEEPVQVLKNLCLNPLARANPEINMMW